MNTQEFEIYRETYRQELRHWKEHIAEWNARWKQAKTSHASRNFASEVRHGYGAIARCHQRWHDETGCEPERDLLTVEVEVVFPGSEQRLRYAYEQVGIQHGFLRVFDAKGTLLATGEEWSDPWTQQRLEYFGKHLCKQGHMIPSGDPRWYTYCQWCGESVEGHKTAYHAGQYHATCYENLFLPCSACGTRSMRVYERSHPREYYGKRPPEPGPALCDRCVDRTRQQGTSHG